VSVNGVAATLGDGADPAHDTITVDGERLRTEKERTYVALHKPAGIISTLSDELGRKTVRDLVPLEGRLVPVGRLDADSEGLVLLTDDGELVNLLTHPRYEVEKEYYALVKGHPAESTLARWRGGVELADFDHKTPDGGRTAPARVEVLRTEGNATWLRIVIHEGRKRHIRRVAELLGHPVKELIRVRIGPVRLGNLARGGWRRLTKDEVARILSKKRPQS
jgi:23S rRNA pseudouridine2605 synthase